MAVECYESRDIVRRLGGWSHHRYKLSCVTLGKICPFRGYSYLIWYDERSRPDFCFVIHHSFNKYLLSACYVSDTTLLWAVGRER